MGHLFSGGDRGGSDFGEMVRAGRNREDVAPRGRVVPGRDPNDVQAAFNEVGGIVTAMDDLISGDENAFKQAFFTYLRSQGEENPQDSALQSCGLNTGFVVSQFCDDTAPTLWRPDVEGFDGVENDVESAMNSGHAIVIDVSGPDHHWVGIPVGNDEVRIYMAWQNIFTLKQWEAANGTRTRNLADWKNNVRDLKSGNRDTRKAALLWFTNPKHNDADGHDSGIKEDSPITLAGVQCRPMKTS